MSTLLQKRDAIGGAISVLGQQGADLAHRDAGGEHLPYPGVDYLGSGYDIIFGNPKGDPDTQLDPGFRADVIELDWCQSQECLSKDMRFLRPLHGSARGEHSCHQSQETRTVEFFEDYSSSLSIDASLSASMEEGEGEGEGPSGSASFSAFLGYKTFARDVMDTNSKQF